MEEGTPNLAMSYGTDTGARFFISIHGEERKYTMQFNAEECKTLLAFLEGKQVYINAVGVDKNGQVTDKLSEVYQKGIICVR